MAGSGHLSPLTSKQNMIEELIREWDGDHVVVRYDQETEAWVFIAIHSNHLGTALGGTRMKIYDTPDDGLRDAQRLAAGMTYKWAGIDFPQGGGKAVIALTKPVTGAAREKLLERYGELVESLRGGFGTGLDLGISPEDILVIARKTKYVHGAKPGGPGDPGPWTALGVFTGIKALVSELFGSDDLHGRTVLIQGIGDVGVPLAKQLVEAGATVKLSDIDAERASGLATELGAETVDNAVVYEEPCDIFAPCAVGGILNAETIARLQCKGVGGSANNQLLEAQDAERLHERGILYAPDFIINAGGAIALNGVEARGMTEAEARERILGIGEVLGRMFAEARERNESLVHSAEREALRVLERGPAT